MPDLELPIMAPAASGGMNRILGLACRAQAVGFVSHPGDSGDNGTSSPYERACGAEPATDLGLCTHHLSTIFPQARSDAS
jgi:hypothetical protein